MYMFKKYADDLYKLAIDLNYDMASTEWRQVEKISRSKLPPFLEGVFRFIWKLIFSIRHRHYPSVKSDIVFLVGSNNNIKSINPVFERLKKARLIGYNGQVSAETHIPEFFFYCRSILAIPKFILSYLSCDNAYIKWTMKKRPDRYLLAFVAISIWEKILKKLECRILVLTNDHVVWARAAMYAAHNLGIKTVFVPHAPTGNGPPELQFDYAFLDGESQFKQYSKRGLSRTVAILSGAVRYEKFVKLSLTKGEGLLVCYNTIDDFDFITSSLSKIVKFKGGREVWVRPHPADRRRFESIRSACQDFGVNFVDPSTPIERDFDDVGYVIAGLSGVHVDGLMAGKMAVTVRGWYSEDYYDLIKLGLLKVLDEWSAIEDMSRDVNSDAELELRNLNWNVADTGFVPSCAVAQFLELLLRKDFVLDRRSLQTDDVEYLFDQEIGAYRTYGR